MVDWRQKTNLNILKTLIIMYFFWLFLLILIPQLVWSIMEIKQAFLLWGSWDFYLLLEITQRGKPGKVLNLKVYISCLLILIHIQLLDDINRQSKDEVASGWRCSCVIISRPRVDYKGWSEVGWETACSILKEPFLLLVTLTPQFALLNNSK